MVTVGDTIVVGRLVKPHTRKYTGYYLPCPYTGDSTERFAAIEDRLDLISRSTDTLLRRIRESTYSDGRVVLDTVLYDRATLAPRAQRWHLERSPEGVSLATGFDVRGRRVSWFSEEGTESHQGLDTTFADAPFLVGTEDLLVQAIPVLYKPNALVSLPMADLRRGGIDTTGRLTYYLAFYHVAADVLGSEPRGLHVEIAHVDFWVDPHTHEVLEWQEPADEGTCPARYIPMETMTSFRVGLTSA